MTTWWRQGTPGVTYVRCDLPARHLGQVLNLEDYPGLVHNDDGTATFKHQDDCSVWSFPGNHMRGLIMEGQRQQGQRVLVEVDDLYLRMVPAHLGRAPGAWQNRVDLDNDGHSIKAHGLICQTLADGIIVSTPRLGQEYSEVNKNVYVCPNTVDPADWLYEKPADGVFRVGFAGSPSHHDDMTLVWQALEWASRQPGVEVVLMGGVGKDLPWATVAAWQPDLASYRKSLFQLDVGLCPLKPGRWTNCKSDLKALEYTMAGALPVVSRVQPYRPWLRHDSPALNADTAKGFLKHMKWCVKNQDEVRARALECKQVVLKERTIEGNLWRWQEAIEGGKA